MKPEQIFHEVYGAYFLTVQRIVDAALNKKLSRKDIESIVHDSAYKETPWLLLERIERGDFEGVVNQDYTTSIHNKPHTPITELEARWLKTISLDPKIKLFDFDFTGLENIEPLYTLQDVYFCGQYGRGDNYNDKEYIQKFRLIASCLRANKTIILRYLSARNEVFQGEVYPLYMQYSLKEDLFRLIAVADGNKRTYNLSRIFHCEKGKPFDNDIVYSESEQGYVEVSIKNDRQTLERFLLYFANYERRTTALNDGTFTVSMRYPKGDETEVLVNILSFAPMVKITAPQEMVAEARKRILRQSALLKN